MDRKYYTRRFEEALASAKSAREITSRIAHEKMAKGYRILAGLAPLAIGNGESDLEGAIMQWESDGGLIRRPSKG